MSPLELGLSAWLTFNLALGVDLQLSLLPPATVAQIESVERAVGYKLPQDLHQLYLQANGQLNPFTTPYTGHYAPMFGRYRFLSLSEALSAYQKLHTQYEADRQWRASSNAVQSVIWDVREGDKVDSAGWNPHWFVFASDETNYYSVDLSPPAGGQKGQVVLHGPDRWELRVIAASLSELLTEASSRLDPGERYRFEQSQMMGVAEGDAWTYSQFSMDWRDQPAAPLSEDPQQSAALDAWYAARESQIDNFMRWLDDNPWSAAEKDLWKEWVYISFSLGPSGLFSEQMPGSLIPPYTHQDYLAALELSLMQSAEHSVDSLPVSRAEAYSLVHQYQLETGRWSNNEYDAAQALVLRIVR